VVRVVLQDGDWRRPIDQLKRGECAPFPGAEACHGTIGVQLLPPAYKPRSGAKTRAREYLARYLAARHLSMYGGTGTEFCPDLHDRLGPRP
jgi:hypothetical protein